MAGFSDAAPHNDILRQCMTSLRTIFTTAVDFVKQGFRKVPILIAVEFFLDTQRRGIEINNSVRRQDHGHDCDQLDEL